MVSDKLKSKAYTISDWEASSRYNDTFYVMKAEIEEAIDLYEELKEQILSRLELENK